MSPYKFRIYVSKVNKETNEFVETKRVNKIVYNRKKDTEKVIVEYALDFVMNHKENVGSYMEMKDYTSKAYLIIMNEGEYNYIVYSM